MLSRTDVRANSLPTEPQLICSIRRGRCHKTAFLKTMYITVITAFAQVVLAQRFNLPHRFECVHSSLPLQNLCDNDEEQMDRGLPVCARHRGARSWSLLFYQRGYEPRSVLPSHRALCQHSSSGAELSKNIFVSCDHYDPSGFV